MPRKSTPVFNISVPVTKSMLNEIIDMSLYGLEDYTDADLRTAGVKVSELRTKLAADDGFRAAITKQMVAAAEDGIRGAIDYSDIGNHTNPLIRQAEAAAEKVAAAREKAAEKDRHKERIKEATELLKSQGFKVVRA